jgi:glycosyltransferase involved in cell wall biosynthesis
MRVAFLTPEYVTESNFDGGLANYLHRLARGLIERGHDVEIFTISDQNGTVEHDGVMVHRVRPESKWFFRLHRFFGSDMLITKGMILESWCLKRSFVERHAALPFDIVQAPSFRASGLALSLCSLVPVVTRVSSHSRLWDEAYRHQRTLDHKVREWLERQTLRRSVRAYAPSKFLAGILANELAFRVDVVRPLFFIEERAPDYSVYDSVLRGLEYLLFVGTIGRLKGAFVLAEALTDMLPRFPEMHVALAGKELMSNGRSSVESFRERLREFQERIHWLGSIPHAQLYPVLEKARVVVLPSLIDNLPNSCMEAIAFGRVVVASKGVSFEELIDDGESGFLAEPGNARALAETVTRAWCLSQSQRAVIGAKARERISLLEPDKTLSALEELYREAIADWSKRKRRRAHPILSR